MERRLTISWDDPAAYAELPADMSFLDIFRAVAAGELPQAPIGRLMGFEILEVEEGRAVVTGRPGEQHCNPNGYAHGGYAATLLDAAMYCAIATSRRDRTPWTTIELKINYIRPLGPATGLVRAEGRAIHVGRRAGTAEGRLLDAAGKLYAHGTTSCMVGA